MLGKSDKIVEDQARIKCLDCKFLNPFDEPVTENAYTCIGECRRNPPTPISPAVYGRYWPDVGANDWCGSAESRHPEKPAIVDLPPDAASDEEVLNWWYRITKPFRDALEKI